MTRWSPGGGDAEEGSATLEFVALTVLVLVPIALVMAGLSLVQRASYAASGAARDAARMYATAPDPGTAGARAQAAARVIFASYTVEQGAVDVECLGACLAPGTRVRATAAVTVPLPGLAAVLGENAMTTVRITSTQVSPVDEFKAVAR